MLDPKDNALREQVGGTHLRRGMWVWDTAHLLDDDAQIDSFCRTAKAIDLTDAYVYVLPSWYEEKGAELTALNAKLKTCGIRVWALDNDPSYIANQTGAEDLILNLLKLIAFNERNSPSARFHGFQAHIEPQDTPPEKGDFHEGVAPSELTPLQKTERDIRMHMWINCHTKASQFLRSYDMPFGAVMPFWLHAYRGEEITMPWSTGQRETDDPDRTCMMDMVMPLLDEYVVRSCTTEPAETIRRIMTQVRFACDAMREGHDMPKVLGSVETAEGRGPNASYTETPGKQDKAVVLADLARIEGVMAKYPAFGGMAIHHSTAWEELPPVLEQTVATKGPVQVERPRRTTLAEKPPTAVYGDTTLSSVHTHADALEQRLNVVLQKLERLKSSA